MSAVQTVKPTDRNICLNFTGATEITPSVAIPYAKLAFVTALGALSEADFSSCVGSTQVKAQPGIELNGVLFNQNNGPQAIELEGFPYYAINDPRPDAVVRLAHVLLCARSQRTGHGNAVPDAVLEFGYFNGRGVL